MLFRNQVLVILVYGLLIWICSFMILLSIVENRVKKKKRIENEKQTNMIQKVLLTKYVDVIPKLYLLSYYVFLLVQFLSLFLCIYFKIVNTDNSMGTFIVKSLVEVDTIYLVIIHLLDKFK